MPMSEANESQRQQLERKYKSMAISVQTKNEHELNAPSLILQKIVRGVDTRQWNLLIINF